MSCYNYRSMPVDFEDHVEERIDDLMRRYHAASATIMRWRDLCGFSRPRGRPWRAVIRRDIFGAEQIFPSIGEAARCTKGGVAFKDMRRPPPRRKIMRVLLALCGDKRSGTWSGIS